MSWLDFKLTSYIIIFKFVYILVLNSPLGSNAKTEVILIYEVLYGPSSRYHRHMIFIGQCRHDNHYYYKADEKE